MLPWDVLQDLNGTIARSRLSVDVLDDLNSTIAADSVTLAMLSPQVRADLNSSIPAASVTASKMHPDLIKYFLPEITSSPVGSTILQGTGTTLAAGVAGKFLTYQWSKNGANLAGETNPTLVIAEANATVHDANYTVVVSNDWGSVTTGAAHLAAATAQPVITLLGDANVTVEAATSYSDAGATAVDAIGGNLNASISVSFNVNLMTTGAYSVLYSVADAGGYLLAGYSDSPADGDKSEAGRGSNDYWAVKINASGTKVWDKRFGGSGDDVCRDAIATTDGGYLLVGDSNSGANGDKSEGTRGGNDMWAVKIDADGNK